MTDINRGRRRSASGPDHGTRAAPEPSSPQRRTDNELLAYVELLFFAYRDFTSDPDSILDQLGYGRAHHRVLHFVNRYPGLRVAELLQILKITKQSLARVLRELIASGHIEQRTGAADRRERLLHATPQGGALARQLALPQIERIARTLAAIGGETPPASSQDTARMFLYHLITPGERAAVDALMARRAPGHDAATPKEG